MYELFYEIGLNKKEIEEILQSKKYHRCGDLKVLSFIKDYLITLGISNNKIHTVTTYLYQEKLTNIGPCLRN